MYGLHKFPFENSSILAISHLFLVISHLFFTPCSKVFYHKIRLLKCYKNIYDFHRISIENSSILAISHLFWRFHTFFSHLFKKKIHNRICLLRRCKNIYDLHRFSIENSSILMISHLFWRFHTFLSHLFPIFFLLCTSPQWYATFKKKVGWYLLPFLNFALWHDLWRHTTDGRTDDAA